MLAFCSQGPILFFGLFTGVIVDRCDRRRLVLTTQIGITLLVTLLSVLTLNHLITGALAESARMETHRVQRYTRPGWDIRLECDTDLAWQAGGLVLTSRYQVWENDLPVFSREWCHRFPSHHRDESSVGDS